jgi:glycosyltransferase involved in cell wall biosynthesis
MKSLFVAQDFPWPARLGTHLRMQQVIATLAGLGELDLFSLIYPNRPDPCEVPAEIGVARLEVVTSPKPVYSAGRRLRWLTSSRLPLEVIAAESEEVRARFRTWAADRYDLVWINRPGTFEAVGRPRLGRTIVDLDDLEDRKIETRLLVMGAEPAVGGPRVRWHRRVATVQARHNAGRWTRFQKGVARSVDTVVLCSEDDLERAGLANAAVVPNGYDPPEHPLGRTEVGDPPIVLFQGSMRYGPNTDGARWLVTDIAPRIRARLPEVRVRLVGDPDGTVTRLDDPPAVTVVGFVPAIESELARADVVVVPLRYASGTRVKILEALAHRIPVVSTTMGAEGLGLVPGRHLLVADDADGLARACVDVLTDPALRERLMAEGQAAFLQNHQWSVARQCIRSLALRTSTPAPSGPGSPSSRPGRP